MKTGDKRFDKKLAKVDVMTKRLQPVPTGVSTVPVPARTDAQTWAALKKINDGLRGTP